MLQHKVIPKEFKNPKLKERFWGKVEIRGINDCWPWMGSLCKGYGQFGIFRKGKAIMMKSHRMAYFYSKGEDPIKKLCCHLCDNTKCCNPNHIFLGTPKENMHDRDKKGRSQIGDNHFKRRRPELLLRGSKHPGAKLTEDIVLKIRSLYQGRAYGNKRIARELGINPATVLNVVMRRAWTHI